MGEAVLCRWRSPGRPGASSACTTAPIASSWTGKTRSNAPTRLLISTRRPDALPSTACLGGTTPPRRRLARAARRPGPTHCFCAGCCWKAWRKEKKKKICPKRAGMMAAVGVNARPGAHPPPLGSGAVPFHYYDQQGGPTRNARNAPAPGRGEHPSSSTGRANWQAGEMKLKWRYPAPRVPPARSKKGPSRDSSRNCVNAAWRSVLSNASPKRESF